MRVIELENPMTCPPCGRVDSLIVIEDDNGRDRIQCPSCARRYWRIGASCRFGDSRDDNGHTFKVFIPEATTTTKT